MPGSQRSSEPWRTSSRRPRSGSSDEPVGDPRREADARVSTDGSSAACDRDGAAHREAEQERPRRADRVDRRARVLDAPVEPLPRLDPVAHLGERELPGTRGASRPTSHSSEALHVPSTSPRLAAVHADDRSAASAGPVTRSSAPVDSSPTRRQPSRTDFSPARASSPIRLITGASSRPGRPEDPLEVEIGDVGDSRPVAGRFDGDLVDGRRPVAVAESTTRRCGSRPVTT